MSIPERVRKLREGQRYLYFVAKQGTYFGDIERQYTGIFSGVTADGIVIFKDVAYLHLPHTKRLNISNNPNAMIALSMIEENDTFIPLDSESGDPIEVTSYDDLEERLIRA